MPKTQAMQRSLAYLRANGWQCARVERWQMRPQAKFGVRIDVWGFGDILACFPSPPKFHTSIGTVKIPGQIALVQTFPAGGWTKHVEKLQTPEIKKAIETWKASGGIVLLHGWKKSGPRGKKKVWNVREEEV